MKIPNYKIEPQKDAEGKEIEKSNAEMTLDIFHFAVQNTFSKDNGQKGRESTLSGSQGRMWGRVQRKLDDAIEVDSKDIALENAEIDLLKKAMDGAAFPILWFRYTSLLQDELETKPEKK